MGSRLIFLHHHGWFPQEGRRRVAEPHNGLPARAGFKPVGGCSRRTQSTNRATLTPRGEEEGLLEAHELSDPTLPRKASAELTTVVTVPQTHSGGRGEHPKALERTLLKELGKLTP